MERAVRLRAQADDRAVLRVQAALLDEPRVDDRVEPRQVLDVVDVPVDVDVLPARRDRAAMGIVVGGRHGRDHGGGAPGPGVRSGPEGRQGAEATGGGA
jgi:hypothetical protein